MHPTERGCLILDRIGRDRTPKEIAAELGVSINTLANLAAKAYRKLGAHSAAAAVLAHRATKRPCLRSSRAGHGEMHALRREGRCP